MDNLTLKALEDLFKVKNVIAIGPGHKFKDGKDTGEDALVFLVEKKEDQDKLSAEDIIPPEIGGIRTDVEQAEMPNKLDDDRKSAWEYIFGGLSVGNVKITAGSTTLTARRKGTSPDLTDFPDIELSIHGSVQPGETVIVSNSHVFCSDPTKDVSDQESRDIAQPGRHHDPNSPVRAELLGHVLIQLDKPNYCDSAFARVLDKKTDTEVIGIGKPTELADSEVGAIWGASTMHGLTRGTVRMVNAAVKVSGHGPEPVLFVGQTITSHMLEPGASGSSAFIDGTTRLTGQGHAGSVDISVFTPIKQVFTPLDLELIQEDGQEKVISLGKIFMEKVNGNGGSNEHWEIKGGPIMDGDYTILSGVTIKLQPGDKTYVSTTGYFSFPRVTEETNTIITISKEGYITREFPIDFK